jgi:hypothetical protein
MPTVDQQLSAVFNAWLPFIFAVVAAAVVIWRVMEWRYKAVNEKTRELYELLNEKTDLANEVSTQKITELEATIAGQAKPIEKIESQPNLSEETKAAVAALERTSSIATDQLKRLNAANNAVSRALSDTRRVITSWAPLVHVGPSSMTRTTCPICGEEAQELPSTGDFDRIICPKHNEFEVSGTAMSIRGGGRASPGLWERAFERAKLRAESSKRPRPRILDADFL